MGAEDLTSDQRRREPDDRPPAAADNAIGYDVVKAAPAYSNTTGLVSGFALAAVVLVLTIAATVGKLDAAQKIDLGFATSLFALGFIGCLFGAYAFASLGGEPSSVATLTYSILVGSAIFVSVIAVLGGFEALSHAFLAESSLVFEVVTAVTAAIAPIFVWSPHWDIVRGEVPPDDGFPRTTEEAEQLIRQLWVLGVFAAITGAIIHFSGALGEPMRWEYLLLTFAGLSYTGAMIVLALAVVTEHSEPRTTKKRTWALAAFQSLMVLVTLALLP